MRRARALVMLGAGCALACLGQPREFAGKLWAGTKPAFADSLELVVPRLMEKADVPGVAIALVQDGALTWTRGFGFADREKRTPVTSQTVFQVASISKSVAAWGVMTLAEQGQIDRRHERGRRRSRRLPPWHALGIQWRRLHHPAAARGGAVGQVVRRLHAASRARAVRHAQQLLRLAAWSPRTHRRRL
ncbi:MAG: hypothetical protein DMD26_14270 [Gemmatimonadetes bacterium]|nr:MAG: hypothetical protein DMD26_14270 [Gemmatimonadota bacterium]